MRINILNNVIIKIAMEDGILVIVAASKVMLVHCVLSAMFTTLEVKATLGK